MNEKFIERRDDFRIVRVDTLIDADREKSSIVTLRSGRVELKMPLSTLLDTETDEQALAVFAAVGTKKTFYFLLYEDA